MKWYAGVPLSVLLVAVCAFASQFAGFNLVLPLVWGTALWVAFDSRKIEITKYKSGLSYGPVLIFFAVGLLWIVGFPWYLHVRYKITHGQAKPKERAQHVDGASEAAPSASPDEPST